jgi:hypothetical protein
MNENRFIKWGFHIVYLYGLFKDDVSNSDYIISFSLVNVCMCEMYVLFANSPNR